MELNEVECNAHMSSAGRAKDTLSEVTVGLSLLIA